MSNDHLIHSLKSQGYFNVRELEDGSVAAMGKLMFTTAIYLGMDAVGWEYRFCFEDPARAEHEFAKLKSERDVPSGWVARRYGSGGAS